MWKHYFHSAEHVHNIRTNNLLNPLFQILNWNHGHLYLLTTLNTKADIIYLIILDRCTKFVVVKHINSYDAGTTVETMCEVFSEFGLLENVHSDRGKNFLSNQFTQFLNHLGIDLTFCSAYHHSSNQAEHAIRNVKNLMKIVVAQTNHGAFHCLSSFKQPSWACYQKC